MAIERKNVLEVEFKKVWNKWAWRVVKCEFQNEKTLELDGRVLSYVDGGYYFSPFPDGYLMSDTQKLKLEEFVKKINEKYGEKVKWRAKEGEDYFFFDGRGCTVGDVEHFHCVDDIRYKLGNYFKTKEETEIALEKIKKVLSEEE